jgi:hypothetical protein
MTFFLLLFTNPQDIIQLITLNSVICVPTLCRIVFLWKNSLFYCLIRLQLSGCRVARVANCFPMQCLWFCSVHHQVLYWKFSATTCLFLLSDFHVTVKLSQLSYSTLFLPKGYIDLRTVFGSSCFMYNLSNCYYVLLEAIYLCILCKSRTTQLIKVSITHNWLGSKQSYLLYTI